MVKKFIFGLAFLTLAFVSRLEAYPAFISYGYRACAMCHYNTQGGGALNDYGRSVFASEIASRAFFSPSTTPESLSESSGFLGATEMPWWLHPGLKYRGLWMQSDPGGSNPRSRWINMQADASLALSLDEKSRWLIYGSIGYFPTPQAVQNSSGALEKTSQWISREYYVRFQMQRSLTFMLGLMDKVYGLRVVDHTAVHRSPLGLGQNDQTHGLQAHYVDENYELTVHPFLGNLRQAADLRQKGVSVLYEKDLKEKHRVGASALYSSNEYMQWTRMAGHSKFGFGEGNSLLTEVGIVQNKPKSGRSDTGGYLFLEGLGLITRGYFMLSQIEYFNQTMSSSSPDQFRWSFGMLAFPMPRAELRTQLVNSRVQSDAGVVNDQWMLQGQIHLSL